MKKKILIISGISVAFVCLFVLVINLYMVYKVKDRITAESDIENILVLGANVIDDRPSLMLKDRLDRGIGLYGEGDKIIMSGDGVREDYNEVRVMKNYAVDKGVPENAIISDSMGVNTYSSIKRLKSEYGIEKVIIVTQQYHLYRALYIADRFGIEAVGVPALDVRYRGQTMRDIREWLARVKDFLITQRR